MQTSDFETSSLKWGMTVIELLETSEVVCITVG